MAKSHRYRKKTIHSRKTRHSKKTRHSRKTGPKRSSRRSAGMYSFSTTKGVGERKVSKNIVLADLKKVFPYDKKNINSLFTKPEYDEWINDVAQANAMWYTFSDYDKHGENYMITDTKEELETLTREKEE